jgi:hypothetical protein
VAGFIYMYNDMMNRQQLLDKLLRNTDRYEWANTYVVTGLEGTVRSISKNRGNPVQKIGNQSIMSSFSALHVARP